ncbi:MAG: glutamate-5-semialdehyde dehydrogenase [Clostridia bacterium]|nr:glutamate-5-semialdehyde dehydrogenase [Clostridia bacterium]
METTHDILVKAKKSAASIAMADTETKNKALLSMAQRLLDNTQIILDANSTDVANAKGVISDVMIDRLMLSAQRIQAMADGIRQVAQLDDPTGRVIKQYKRDDGLLINKVSVPFGVVGIIYESRPNVTSDAAALAIKSGNACVLRCGKEAAASANAIVDALRLGLSDAGINSDCVSLIKDTTRASATEMMTANGYIDLLIPRGGPGLINACVQNATVNCIQTGTGICHIYVDKDADIQKALDIVENAKMSRPSVCNAMEVCLVHKDIAPEFLPLLKKRLCDDRAERGEQTAQLRCDDAAYEIIGGVKATDADFDTEFLDYIMAVKVVGCVNCAIEHILAHSTGHSEAIITENESAANKFCAMTDSAAVYVNASTRFTDGGEFGLGCEMGISTQKLHARGPMGLEELNTYKYVIIGNGNIR